MSTLMALSFSLACIVPAVSSAAGTALAPDSEAPAVQQIATDWYASHFGVSKTVAAQRLQIQDAAMPQVELLPVLLGSSYGGAWFDPSDGGRLEIGVVDPVASAAAVSQALEAFAPSGVDAYTDIVPVRSSWSDLTSAEASLNSSLHNLLAAGLVQLSIDTSVNSVDVTTAATITPADQAEVQAAVANAPVSVRVVPSANSSLIAQTSACSVGAYIECDPPLRGGDFIFSSNGWECSATTVVEGSGIFYLMTAGHCGWVADQSGWSEYFSNGGGHAIGSAGYNYEWDLYGDDGIITINNPSGWGAPGAHSYVYVQGVPGETTTNETYQLTSAGHAPMGATICGSAGITLSTGYHTDCGTVIALNVSTTEDEDGTYQEVTGLGETNACMGTPGASGGPFYKNGVGYGLMSAFVSSCNSLYQGLTGALSEWGVSLY